jgi:death-on-curing protein
LPTPRFLTADDLIEINRDEVAETGEPFGVRDIGLLESAAARPRMRFELTGDDDAARLAASLGYGLARNHVFLQGNKRTAATALTLFLLLNGYDWVSPDDGWLAGCVLGVVKGELAEDALAKLIAVNIIGDEDGAAIGVRPEPKKS